MPPLANRDAVERQIVQELEPVFEAQYRRALATPSAIPYGDFEADLTRTMERELTDVFLSAGTVLLIGNAVVLTAAAFDQAAKNWAGQYARDLAREVVATSQRVASQAVRDADGDKQTLREELAAVFMADQRLHNIAVTEVTRAASAGEHAAVFFYHRDESRPRLIPIWRTSRRSNVCPRCRPLDGHSREVWAVEFPFGPPGHVNCACHLDWVESAVWARRAA